MTQFNPENKDSLTYGELLDPAMSITDQADADQYFAAMLKYQTEHMQDASGNHTPEQVCRINLGYYAGYFGIDVQERVQRLFLAPHPTFGAI